MGQRDGVKDKKRKKMLKNGSREVAWKQDKEMVFRNKIDTR